MILILKPIMIQAYNFEDIIEGDQIQVAAFSLDYFSYLTGLTLGH